MEEEMGIVNTVLKKILYQQEKITSEHTDINIKPIMILLADTTQHMIGEYCIISKVGIINDIAYIYNEVGGKWYKVDLLEASVEVVNGIEIKNIKQWEYKSVKKVDFLWAIANSICISAMIWSGSSLFQIDDAFIGITGQINNRINKYNLAVNISSEGWRSQYNDIRINTEELIRKIDIGNNYNKKANQKIHINESWKTMNSKIEYLCGENTKSIIPAGTANFTRTVYICPNCRENITKVLLEETYINVEEKKEKINKTFSCKWCNSFYAPVFGWNLDQGKFYYLKVSSNRYTEIIKKMDENARERSEF